MKRIVFWYLKRFHDINIEDLQENFEKMKEENDVLIQEQMNLQSQLKKQKEELKRREGNCEKEISELKVSRDEDRDEIENLKRQYDSLQTQFQQVNENNQKLKAETSNQKSTIDNLKKEKKEQANKTDSFLKEIEELKKKLQLSTNKDEINHDTGQKTIEEELSPIELINGSTIIIEGISTDNETKPLLSSTKRTIDTVIDIENDKEIDANNFFSQPEGVIFKVRTELENANRLHKPKFVCKYCGQMVKISGRKTERGVARFFSHFRDSDKCDCKTTTGRTKREINREKFACCNEGERHKSLKAEIAKYLQKTKGVTDVRTENTIIGNHPVLRWRRPDVIANYRGQEVVFELQLSTTFVSVIAERDMFYRLNKKHIIWVSNFDEQGKHVDLTNMMVKDIYYNNRMNIFIFDSDARRKSEELGELVLKCNWLKPDGDWQYPNGNTSDKLGGEFVCLSDLKFNKTFKPYYVDAEQDYYAAHQEFKIKVEDIEKENENILAELDKRWEEEEKRKKEKQKKTKERFNEIIEENEIDSVIKETQTYIIAQRQGLRGLITYDGQIRMPFIYNEIRPHKGWYEGRSNGSIEVFDADYELIDTDIRLIEELGDNYKKYVKENVDNLLWGIMTKNAKRITLPIFSKIDVWYSDKFIAVQDGLYCILNKEGRIIIAGYDFIGELDPEGVAVISKDGREGRIDSECQVLKTDTEIISDTLSKISKSGKWGLENSDGTILVSCEYDDLGSFNNGIVGLSGIHFSQLPVRISADCPVRVKYVSRNERKMLIFQVGNREAFMNLRQQQKATKKGLKPIEMTQMYFSHVNEEKNLLYLSATPVKTLGGKQQMDTKDSDIPVGSIVEGNIVHVEKNFFIIKSDEGQTAYLHCSTWGEYSEQQFDKGQMVKVEKTGFDDNHKKHVWKILFVS